MLHTFYFQVQDPPTKIKGTGSGNCEPFEELKKSFHCGGASIASMGIINYTNYQFHNCKWCAYWNICDFESYSGKSGALLSGVSTLGSDLYLNAGFSGSAAATIDVYLHYDIKLNIKDGLLTIHV